MLTNISNFPFLFQNSIDKNPIFSPPIKKKIQLLFIYLIFLGNNVIQEEDEPVIISRNDIAVEQDISSNGIHHHTNGNGVRYPKENNDIDHHNNILNNDKNADQQSNGKTSQSYLALTKLGMGGGGGTNKNGGSSPKETKKSDSPMPNSKNGIKEGITTKRKGMAEMAASTLKGFTKM